MNMAKSSPSNSSVSTVAGLPAYLYDRRYKVLDWFGTNGCEAIDTSSKKRQIVWIKMENGKVEYPQLQYERRVYKILKGGDGIRNILKYFCDDEGRKYLVLQHLPFSLEDAFICKVKPFTLKTVLLCADQMLTRVEYLHSKGFIHRDLRPENFLVDDSEVQIYISEFGLSKKYIVNRNDHMPDQRNKRVIGSPRFLSVNAQLGLEASRRDDMESLGYIFIYLLNGELPWDKVVKPSGSKSWSLDREYGEIRKMKQSCSIQELCKGQPKEFEKYFTHCRQLNFKETPMYEYLRTIFRILYRSQNFEDDKIYDWQLE